MFLRILLFPFAVLYNWITRFRNHLYNISLKPSVRFDIPVIGVGNLTVGGTGKTPMIEYLIRLLKEKKIATLSRGYGRKTRGFRIAGSSDDATTIGDEPLQYYNKFGEKVCIAVGEDRALGIPNILYYRPDREVVLLDDAFQHRRVKPSLTILLTDFNNPFYTDYLLPAGRLRESREGASRADLIVVTKCPNSITSEQMKSIELEINQYADKPIFFCGIHYSEPKGFASDFLKVSSNVILVTGIANPEPLENYISSQFTIIEHIRFADHHYYSKEDIQRIASKILPNTSIITTEKDMVKLKAAELQEDISNLPIFYLPMEIFFVKNGEEFDAIVKEKIQST